MDHLGEMKEVQENVNETMTKIKQAPILVTKDNLPEIRQVNNEFNYHGGLSEVELEMLKKMVHDNIEKTSEVDDINN